jgi:ABC-type nitrate/sulfonate/bicarbonate transport system substrate-binding protein
MDDVCRTRQSSSAPLRLGFVPMSDCAPIAVAMELGIFDRYGIQVELSRLPGWSDVRDLIYHGRLDAAQCIAGIAFSLGFGFNDPRCEVVVPLVLNSQGNAITLSTRIDTGRIGGGEGLAAWLEETRGTRNRPFTLAATHRFSSHHILLHTWLKLHGLSVPEDVKIIFQAPPLMPGHMREGKIDGYCVGEPWNSEAIQQGIGWNPVNSTELSHGHPEKVLLVSGPFLREQRDETVALVASLLEACRACQDPDFRDELISILALPEYIGASPRVLRRSLEMHPDCGESLDRAYTPNRPTVDKAAWVLAGLRDIGALPNITGDSLSRIYREDLFQAGQLAMRRC